jgi:nucleoside-diphosphate-sugar epimerase
MIAYLEKIDYVHTRLSVPLAKNLSGGTYVSETLKKIIEGKPFDPPINNKLFDVVFTDDVARAYYLIGFHGRNKANYFIGTERPATLEHYFKRFAHLVKGNDFPEAEINVSDKSMTFDVSPLHADTGFMASSRFEEIIEKVSGP